MIDKYLINRIRSRMSNGKKVDYHLVDSLLENYELLAKQNAELHKELAKLKGDRVFVVNDSHDDMEVNKIVSWRCSTK